MLQQRDRLLSLAAHGLTYPPSCLHFAPHLAALKRPRPLHPAQMRVQGERQSEALAHASAEAAAAADARLEAAQHASRVTAEQQQLAMRTLQREHTSALRAERQLASQQLAAERARAEGAERRLETMRHAGLLGPPLGPQAQASPPLSVAIPAGTTAASWHAGQRGGAIDDAASGARFEGLGDAPPGVDLIGEQAAGTGRVDSVTRADANVSSDDAWSALRRQQEAVAAHHAQRLAELSGGLNGTHRGAASPAPMSIHTPARSRTPGVSGASAALLRRAALSEKRGV